MAAMPLVMESWRKPAVAEKMRTLKAGAAWVVNVRLRNVSAGIKSNLTTDGHRLTRIKDFVEYLAGTSLNSVFVQNGILSRFISVFIRGCGAAFSRDTV